MSTNKSLISQLKERAYSIKVDYSRREIIPFEKLYQIYTRAKLGFESATPDKINEFEKIVSLPLLESDALQSLCDYSFGDQSGVLGKVPGAYMRKANKSNLDFIRKVKENPRKVMTLFVDNIRLYKRPLKYSDWLHMKPISSKDRKWLNTFANEDLLHLCSTLPETKFIIFTALEDTPLDNYIKIPKNVLSINAANGVIFGGKIVPYPHGLERKMYPGYNHHHILRRFMLYEDNPTKLLYVNHRQDTGNRKSIYNLFKDYSWATVSPRVDYATYLSGIKNHKFVLCPSGNGIESARNWETLYLKKVPIFKNHPYLKRLFRDFPAVFVDEFESVNEKLLLKNENLYKEAQRMDYNMLNLHKVFLQRSSL